jgi:hypothetical protein
MVDVFISYSRKDTAFVRRLSDAPEQRQREPWVDWEGIRPTEEFMLAIYAGRGVRASALWSGGPPKTLAEATLASSSISPSPSGKS